METHHIASIRPGSAAKPLKIRVVRKWTLKSRQNDTWYLFVDANGDAIQAIAGKNDRQYIDSHLALTSCYELNGYVCAPTKSGFQVVKHHTTLKIGQATQILPLDEDNSIPHFHFQFRRFADLRAIANDTEQHADYIGIIQSTREGITSLKDPYLKISLLNENHDTISLAVWKETLQTIDNATRKSLDTHDVVLAVTSISVTTYNDRLQIQTTNSSAIYINPNIPETKTLTNSHSRSHLQAVPLEIPFEITLESLSQAARNEIAGKTFTLCSSIIGYNEGSEWYYPACPICEIIIDKIEEKGKPETWICAGHGITNSPKFMFRICATLADHTGTVPVTIFNDAAKQLIKKTAFELVVQEGYNDSNIIPPALLAAISQPKTFSITAPPAYFRQLTFTVQHVSEQPPYQHEESSILGSEAPASIEQTPLVEQSEARNLHNPTVKKKLFLESSQQEDSTSSKKSRV